MSGKLPVISRGLVTTLTKTPFVHVLGFNGDNILEPSINCPWCKGWQKSNCSGKTLFEAIDALLVPQQAVDKPLHLPISNVYNISGIGTVPVDC